jgi:hypothetical protein
MRRKLVDPETRTFVDQVHSANIRRPEYLSTQIFVDPNICQPKYSSTWIVLFIRSASLRVDEFFLIKVHTKQNMSQNRPVLPPIFWGKIFLKTFH